MAGPQAQRPISHEEGASASRALREAESQMEIDLDSNRSKEDIENGSSTKRVRHKHRPLYRRLFNYIRTAWTGVSFSSGNGIKILYFSCAKFSKTLFSLFFSLRSILFIKIV